MSFNSFLQPTQTLCQQDFTLVAGTLANAPIGGIIGAGGASPAGTYQTFSPQTSRIIGVGRKTAGGSGFTNVAVSVLAPSIAQVLAGSGAVSINSTVNTDTSTYTVYWVNSLYPNLNPC